VHNYRAVALFAEPGSSLPSLWFHGRHLRREARSIVSARCGGGVRLIDLYAKLDQLFFASSREPLDHKTVQARQRMPVRETLRSW